IAGGGVVAAPAFVRTPASAQETPSPLRPDPTAKRGGTLRYAVHNAPAHFDVHQSGTVANIGPQSPMYDTLLRRHPKDGQTIIPDLAWRWEISPDNKKYTFYLRKGVKFHDGADFTAEDVKATYERIARPPKGVVIPRTPLSATVGDIVVVPVRQGRLRAPVGSGLLAQGQGDAGRHRGGVQPVGHPGLLDEHGEEQGPGQSEGASRHSPRHGPPRPGRGGQGHGADAGGRLRLSLPRDVHAARRAGKEARLPEGRHAGGPGSPTADEGSRLRQRD